MSKLIKNKPSEYVQDLLDGIEWAKKHRDKFMINMRTFGSVEENGICVGCCATAALQAINDRPFSSNEIGVRKDRAAALNEDTGDVDKFEEVINLLRIGDLNNFFIEADEKLCGENYEMINTIVDDWDDLWRLNRSNWESESELNTIRKFQKVLISKGL